MVLKWDVQQTHTGLMVRCPDTFGHIMLLENKRCIILYLYIYTVNSKLHSLNVIVMQFKSSTYWFYGLASGETFTGSM